MAQPQIYQGSWEELNAIAATFQGRKNLTLIIPAEEADGGHASDRGTIEAQRSHKMHDATDRNFLLTEEQRTQLERALSGYGEQGVNGYDLSLFRENLRRTPTERIERLQAAVDFFVEVKRARGHQLSKKH